MHAAVSNHQHYCWPIIHTECVAGHLFQRLSVLLLRNDAYNPKWNLPAFEGRIDGRQHDSKLAFVHKRIGFSPDCERMLLV